nr:hypothetical protein [Mycobacterium lepromatosis]
MRILNGPQFPRGVEKAAIQVQAAVPFYGVYDLTGPINSMHPIMLLIAHKYVFKLKCSDRPHDFRVALPITHIDQDVLAFYVTWPQPLAGPG